MTRCVDGTNCSCQLDGGDNVTITGNGCAADPFIINANQPEENGAPFTIIGDGGGGLIAVTPGVPYTPVWDFEYNGPEGTKFVGPGPVDIQVNGSNQIIAGSGGVWSSDGSSGRRWFLFDIKILAISYGSSPFGVGQYVNFNVNSRYQSWIFNSNEAIFCRSFVLGLYPNDDVTPTITTFGGLGLSSSGWNLTIFKIARD